MGRRVKEFIEIKDPQSLDALIDRLAEIRSALPDGAEPVLALKGDDVFGRFLSVSYWRPQTLEEADADARYASASRQQRLARSSVAVEPTRRLRSVG